MIAARSIHVVRSALALALPLLIVVGCGGSGGAGLGSGSGEVSGVVTEPDGSPIIDARVYTTTGEDRETSSSSSGTYLLRGVSEGDLLIQGEAFKDGDRYVGQNVARVFADERTKSTNLVLINEDLTATLRGTVRTPDGGLVEGARVFARHESDISSSMDVTDSEGRFVLRHLDSTADHEILANAPGLRSDNLVVNLAAGEDRTIELIVSLGFDPGLLSPPTGLSGTAWTSPEHETVNARASSHIEAIKQIIQPKRATRTAANLRTAVVGSNIEIDLTWNRVTSDFLLGYGVYRAPLGSALQATDFLRDPLAEFYSDLDDFLTSGSSYRYALTAINTDQEEGSLSSSVTVETLGELNLLTPNLVADFVRFRWSAALGAEEYAVYLFDEFPAIGVNSIYSNDSNRTANTNWTLSGFGLIPGATYYYVVVGFANDDTSISISDVSSFVAN